MTSKVMNRKWICPKCGKGYQDYVTKYVADKRFEMHNKLMHPKK